MAACDGNSCAPPGLATAAAAQGQGGSLTQGTADGQQPLQSLLECPICHEVAQPPIFTCIGSHHMFCSDCRNKVQLCPLCKTTICDQRCLFAEQCMEHMRLPCKYYNEGCKAVLKGTEYRTHLNTCPMRPIECFISRCGKKIPFFQYFDHIKEAHRNKVNGIDDCNKHIVEWWIEGDPAATARWPPYYFTCFNQVFLYMAISTVHGMWEWVWIIGNDEDAKRFRVISRVENVEKMAELTWKGAVHSIRKTVHEIVSSGLAFVTNSKELRNPYLFRKSGEGSRYFWRTDVEIVQVEAPGPGAMMYLETKEGQKKATSSASKNKTLSLNHSTTEAPEIIGNAAGKGFMRQSGPNSLTPSQIISLEEENKNTGSRTASNTNISIRKSFKPRESNMVGKASITVSNPVQQDIISVKSPSPTFQNPNINLQAQQLQQQKQQQQQQFGMMQQIQKSSNSSSREGDIGRQWHTTTATTYPDDHKSTRDNDYSYFGLPVPEPNEPPPVLISNTAAEAAAAQQHQQHHPAMQQQLISSQQVDIGYHHHGSLTPDNKPWGNFQYELSPENPSRNQNISSSSPGSRIKSPSSKGSYQHNSVLPDNLANLANMLHGNSGGMTPMIQSPFPISTRHQEKGLAAGGGKMKVLGLGQEYIQVDNSKMDPSGLGGGSNDSMSSDATSSDKSLTGDYNTQ